MKRQLSLVLCLSLLCSMLIGVPMLTNAATERTDKVWYEADFDDGTLDDPFHIRNNYDIGGPTADYGFADDGNGGKALHITNRTTNYGGLEIDVSEMVKNTEIRDGEGYSMGFRIKAEEGESFYVTALIYGGGDGCLGNNYTSWRVTDDKWTDIKLGANYFTQNDKDGVTDWMNGTQTANIILLTSPNGTGDSGNPLRVANQAGYYIDDVQVSAPADVETEGTVRADGVWYETDFDNEAMGDVQLRNSDGTVNTEYTEDGNGGKALHVISRPVYYNGIHINVSEMLKNTEIRNGEGYSMGFRMKAEAGEKFWLRVELYDPKNAGGEKVDNGYLGSIESYFLITDEWTLVPLGRYFFTSGYDSGRGWANSAVSGNIGFVTFDCGDNDVRGDSNTAGFYIDDVQVSAPYDQAQAVAAFVAAVQALPAAGEVAHEDGGAIDSALAMYEDLSTYTGLNLKAVQQAKAVLDEIKAAYDALGSENPDPEKEPPYTETFNSQAVGPVQGDEGPVQGLEIANDPAEARDGSRYLHVVQRDAAEERPFFYHNVNEEIADQGTGTYELRFYAKAKGGETQLLVLKGEVYLPLVTVTEEWVLYTIPLNEENTVVTEEDLKGLTFTFRTGYDGKTNELFFDDIAFVRTGAYNPDTDPDPGPTIPDTLISDGGFENAAEGEVQWNGVVVRDESAPEGEQYLRITDRPVEGEYFEERSVWGTPISLERLRADEGGNYKLSFWLRAANAGEQTQVAAYIVGTKIGKEYYDWYFNMIPTQEGVNGAIAGNEWVKFESAPLSLNDLAKMDSAMLVITNWNELITDCDLDGVALIKTEETPPVDMVVEPEYTYDNPANLLDPYGTFDTLKDGNMLWNGMVVNDPQGAHSGDNYLLISDRTEGAYRFDFSLIGLQNILKDNGAGMYYYSCWLKTKNEGDTTVLQPILYYDDTGAEYWMPRITVTDEWTFFGVTYDEVNSFFNAENGGLPVPGAVAEFRFYNAPGQETYPDYCIDDLAFWKYYEEQSTEEPDDGNQSETGGRNPHTGVGLPVLPVVAAALAGSTLAVVRRRRRA